jgi:hypothetical protein
MRMAAGDDQAPSDDLDWIDVARARLVMAFSRIEGVSSKLANMILSDILLGGRPDDPDWVAVGATCIVVDSLVHKFLDRTGILKAFKAPHAYGVACHRVAETKGFEPSRRFPAYSLSRGAPSTTRPRLRRPP